MAPSHSFFDVRTTVSGSDLDEESIQVTYDAINRTVILIGDVPFERLFVMPMRELSELVISRLPVAAAHGVLRDQEIVRDLIRELTAKEPEATLAGFYIDSRYHTSTETYALLRRLRRYGIRVPLPVSDETLEGAREKVIAGLRRDAPDWTFLAMVTETAHGKPEHVRKALSEAKLMGLFTWTNDRCCKKHAPDDDDECASSPGKYCAISNSPIANGLCVALSDPCPAAAESSEKSPGPVSDLP